MALQILTSRFKDGIASELSRRYYAEISARIGADFTGEDVAHATAADFEAPAGVFLVAYDETKPVGCGGLRRIDDRTAEIKHLFVDPTHRGKGVGSALITALEEEARTRHAARVVLDTSSVLHEAIALYHRRGYREIAPYNDNPFAQHWFELDLDDGRADLDNREANA